MITSGIPFSLNNPLISIDHCACATIVELANEWEFAKIVHNKKILSLVVFK